MKFSERNNATSNSLAFDVLESYQDAHESPMFQVLESIIFREGDGIVV